MTKEELIARLKDIEWDDFEVKEAADALPKSVWETVSAFSNTSGGWLVLGVRQIGKRSEIQGVLRDRIQSNPRNPGIIKLFRYAKLGENAGYGIDKMLKWESLTGEKVVFSGDIESAVVTYFRPGWKGEVETESETAPLTTPKTTPKIGVHQRNQILQIIRVTPDISKEKISELIDLTVDGVKYHLRKLKSEGRIEWVGPMKSGCWKIVEVLENDRKDDRKTGRENQKTGQVSQKDGKRVIEKVIENPEKVIEKVIEKASLLGEKLTENKMKILRLIVENPNISKAEISRLIGISENSVSRNIEAMRNKYICRVGSDKGGHWEIIV